MTKVQKFGWRGQKRGPTNCKSRRNRPWRGRQPNFRYEKVKMTKVREDPVKSLGPWSVASGQLSVVKA